MSETYLPVKESLGYKNVKTALLNIFQMNLDDLFILENSYEGFNFSITYRGYDVEMGARPLRRTLQTKVEDKLAELLLTGDLQAGQTLKVGVKAGQLKFDIA